MTERRINDRQERILVGALANAKPFTDPEDGPVSCWVCKEQSQDEVPPQHAPTCAWVEANNWIYDTEEYW